MRISVAIDGPAGAGKSTIAKILGKRLGLMYINTGAMYRAVTLKALNKDISPNNVEALCNMIKHMKMTFDDDRLIVDDEDVSELITTPEISNTVSKYAAIKEVRERLVDLQRQMSLKYDVIMDGRDIGTVVLKNAAFKFFLTASPEERAKRRYDELLKRNINVVYDNILQEIVRRDFEDTHREVDPLMKAEDAVEIDTTGLSINQVVDTMFNYILNEINSTDY